MKPGAIKPTIGEAHCEGAVVLVIRDEAIFKLPEGLPVYQCNIHPENLKEPIYKVFSGMNDYLHCFAQDFFSNSLPLNKLKWFW